MWQLANVLMQQTRCDTLRGRSIYGMFTVIDI